MMQVVAAILISCTFFTTAEIIKGSGASFTFGPQWFSTYNLLYPQTTIQYSPSSGPGALRAIVDGIAPYLDFAFLDSAVPTASDLKINPNIRIFPIASSTIIPQINIPALGNDPTPFVLSREALVGIFQGTITQWNDPMILFSNPYYNGTLPAANITVVYRSDFSGMNQHLSTILSSFSSTWPYGVSNTWPLPLQNLPNQVPASGNVITTAKIIAIPNSIGFVGFTTDPSTRVACLYNKYEVPVCPTPDTLAAAVSSLVLNETLYSSYAIDSEVPNAWISGTYLYGLVHTTFDPVRGCDATSDFYRFLHWAFTDPEAALQVGLASFSPLSPNVSKYVLHVLSEIQCNGNSVLGLQALDKRTYVHQILIVLNTLFMVFVIALCGAQLYFFASSVINQVYTLLYLTGSIITLSAPFVWNMIPNQTSVCLSRAWLTSLGLSLLLGTMFSRTWQLKEIYNLHKHHVDNLNTQITLRTSLIKLGMTMSVVLGLNCSILLVWTLADPYSAYLKPIDTNLHGLWSCASFRLSTWMFLQITLLAFLVGFGVYVIYKTWSFQHTALVRETRWVLLVLYNIVLNVVAAFPSAVLAKANDELLAILMMASLMFSGGGIVLAFLLPRLLRLWRHRNDDPNKKHYRESGDGHDHTSPPSSPYSARRKSNSGASTPKAINVKAPYLATTTSETQLQLTPLGDPRTLSSSLSTYQSTPSTFGLPQSIELSASAISLPHTGGSPQSQAREADILTIAQALKLNKDEMKEEDEEEISASASPRGDSHPNLRKVTIDDVSGTNGLRDLRENQSLLESPSSGGRQLNGTSNQTMNWSSNPLANHGSREPSTVEEESHITPEE